MRRAHHCGKTFATKAQANGITNNASVKEKDFITVRKWFAAAKRRTPTTSAKILISVILLTLSMRKNVALIPCIRKKHTKNSLRLIMIVYCRLWQASHYNAARGTTEAARAREDSNGIWIHVLTYLQWMSDTSHTR